jgi:hypothetical protein
MTSTNELDRLLGEWLDDGPNRAPDRPLELALGHARSHPRRRDFLGFLRPDAMAPQSRGFAFGLRPALVLAVVALLLAAVAIGIGGPKPSAIVPEPSASASPSAATSPSASASASPSPSSSPSGQRSFGILVDLTVPEGQPQTVDVFDASGKLVVARSGSPTGETGQSFPFDSVEVTNIDATTLQLGWAGYPCKTDHQLLIELDPKVMTLLRPACAGTTDTIGVDRILILQFSEPIDASSVNIALKLS